MGKLHEILAVSRDVERTANEKVAVAISKFGKRPMHLFGAMGTLLFFIGFAIGIYLAVAKYFFMVYKMTDRPLFYFGLLAMILGTQLFMTGFLAEMVSRSSSDRNVYHVEKEIGI